MAAGAGPTFSRHRGATSVDRLSSRDVPPGASGSLRVFSPGRCRAPPKAAVSARVPRQSRDQETLLVCRPCHLLPPEHVGGHDSRRKQRQSPIDGRQVINLVWIGQMSNVPGQQEIQFSNACRAQVQRAAFHVGRGPLSAYAPPFETLLIATPLLPKTVPPAADAEQDQSNY